MDERLFTLQEAQKIIEIEDNLIHGDQWVAVGTEQDKDWMQIGKGKYYPGQSHVKDNGGYPEWGDQ